MLEVCNMTVTTCLATAAVSVADFKVVSIVEPGVSSFNAIELLDVGAVDEDNSIDSTHFLIEASDKGNEKGKRNV